LSLGDGLVVEEDFEPAESVWPADALELEEQKDRFGRHPVQHNRRRPRTRSGPLEHSGVEPDDWFLGTQVSHPECQPGKAESDDISHPHTHSYISPWMGTRRATHSSI